MFTDEERIKGSAKLPAHSRHSHAPLKLLAEMAAEHGRELVALFYDTLLRDQEAAQFLNHAVVQERLSSSLIEWLTQLFSGQDIRDSPEKQARQKIIGEVHARIKIPVHLVMTGALVIKTRLAELLQGQAVDPLVGIRALQLADARMDTAVMLISQSYVKDTTARARLDEAYRLFSLDQDAAVDKETQRASLMEWSQNTLFALLQAGPGGGLLRLGDSAFGLWLRHRAQFMFEQSAQFSTVVRLVERIDEMLLPELDAPRKRQDGSSALADLRAAVDEISFLVADLLQTLSTMEGGRDPLTRALNRRFLPAILGREVTFAKENGTALSVMLVDIDHFKAINDRHGHQVGDEVLRQVAQVIVGNVRATDFVFRYGGEEFLIVLVETGIEAAANIAERIRADMEGHIFETGSSGGLSVTASFGIALHSGHPDQKFLIKAADEALYRAKAAGRNTVELAPIYGEGGKGIWPLAT